MRAQKALPLGVIVLKFSPFNLFNTALFEAVHSLKKCTYAHCLVPSEQETLLGSVCGSVCSVPFADVAPVLFGWFRICPWATLCVFQLCRFRTVAAPHTPTPWGTTISSKVNLHHAIDFMASCGANLDTYPP